MTVTTARRRADDETRGIDGREAVRADGIDRDLATIVMTVDRRENTIAIEIMTEIMIDVGATTTSAVARRCVATMSAIRAGLLERVRSGIHLMMVRRRSEATAARGARHLAATAGRLAEVAEGNQPRWTCSKSPQEV